MNRVSPSVPGPDPPAGPALEALPGSQSLPLRATDLDAVLAGLYRRALRGDTHGNLVASLCQQLGRLLRLRLVVLSRRLEGGAVSVEGASRENGLWLELQRIPERWDGGISANGPAGEALRRRVPLRMSVDHEGFALWRVPALAEQARQILAVPLGEGAGRVLELYFDGLIPLGATSGTVTIEGLALMLAGFLDDVATIEERALLAHALDSAGDGAFITDLEGTIVWSNAAFSALSGYRAEDVRGRNPSVLRSGQQGVRYYRELWGTIRAGNVWRGETVDRDKDGNLYTIHQTVSPVARDGRITHYLSMHHDIGRDKRAQSRLELASHLHPASGLLTRAAFEESARRAIEETGAQACALIIISLRGVQRVAGDLDVDLEDFVATLLGKRLREGLGAADLAGMLGASEYGLLVGGDVTAAALEERLEKLAERLNEPIPWLGHAIQLDAHFGTALFPHDGSTLAMLWARADRKLADEPYRRARRHAPN